MTILIKGMDLPRSCDDCPCSHVDEDEDIFCMITLREGFMDSRPSWCPMHKVEEAWYSHHPQKNVYAKLP